MTVHLQNLKVPEALPVVIQLDNTDLAGFLKSLMSALHEITTDVVEVKDKASSSEATSFNVLKQVSKRKTARNRLDRASE